jgi:colanic acid/amylovoran biosynthesis glycosyltransferase
MKIAYLVDEFPSMSQTFILNQITGMIDAGHRVCIFADGPSNAGKIHSQYKKYNLLEKPVIMVLKIAGKNLQGSLTYYSIRETSCHIRSLNFFRYGKSPVFG